MKAPDKIYIDKKDAEIPSDYYAFSMPPYVNHKYIEYIRKDALLEWAKEIAENASWVSIDAVVNKIESL